MARPGRSQKPPGLFLSGRVILCFYAALRESLVKMNVTRSQVSSFLDSARNLPSLPSDLADLEPAVLANSQRARELVKTHFGLTLTPDATGLKILDDLLNAMHIATLGAVGKWLGRKISLTEATIVAESLGAFFGEVVQSQLGGRWGFENYDGHSYVALRSSSGTSFIIIQKAGKQFENGEEDSVQFFYKVLADPSERELY